LFKTEAPAVMIPSIQKTFITIVGLEYISIYPQDSKHKLKTEYERSEFRKFLKDFEKFFG
jgi:hypothetical protein